MKSVLISIQPKWVEKIASGKKTIEVRKSRPKLETPFKCYIYCTKDKYQHIYDLRPFTNGEISLSLTQHNKTSLVPQNYWNGKVIGEFVCDKIYDLFPFGMGTGIELLDELVSPEMFCKESCLTEQEICDYIGEKDGYGWHISDLKIYNKPKELSEFKKPCYINEKTCYDCQHTWGFDYVKGCNGKIEKAPQSWCYVGG